MKTQAKYLAVHLAFTLGLHFVFDLPLGYTALAVFVGWPVLGTVVTADDDLPGGWSNPDGTVPPPWATAWFWGVLSLRFSIAMVAFLVETMMFGAEPWSFTALAVVSAVLAVVLLKGDTSHVQESS